jgi:hypothetical protein
MLDSRGPTELKNQRKPQNVFSFNDRQFRRRIGYRRNSDFLIRSKPMACPILRETAAALRNLEPKIREIPDKLRFPVHSIIS